MHGNIQNPTLDLVSFGLLHFPQPPSFLYGAGSALCGVHGCARSEHPLSLTDGFVAVEKGRASAADEPWARRVLLHGVMTLRAGENDRLSVCLFVGNECHLLRAFL